MLPNLTEDVGFFASFWPLYTHEYHGGDCESKDSKEEKVVKEKKGVKKSTKSDIPIVPEVTEEVIDEPMAPSKDQSVGTEKSDQVANNSSDEDNSSEASGSTSTNKSFEILDSKDLNEQPIAMSSSSQSQATDT